MNNDYCGFSDWGPCEPSGILALTGMDGSDPALWTTAAILILGSGILFVYNHLRKKDKR